MKTLFLILVVLLSGCETLRQSLNNPNVYQPATKVDSFDSSIETCKKELQDNISKEKRECDLVSYNTKMDQKSFFEACLKDEKQKDCDKKFNEMLSARITLEYPNANYEKVNLWCKSEPIVCDFRKVDGVVEYERNLYNSQKDFEKEKRENQQADRRSRNMQALGVMLKGMGDGLRQSSQSPTTCTSTKVGYSVQTTCY